MNLERDLLDLFLEERDNLDGFVKHLPCSVHINSRDDFRLLYLDPRILSSLGYDSLVELGKSSVTLDMCNPHDLDHAKEICLYYLENIEEYSTYSFIQRILYQNGRYHAMYTTGMLVEELGGLLQFSVDIQRIIDQVGNLDEIIEDDEFIRVHFHKVDRLTNSEYRILPLWLSHLKNDEIANRLSVSEQTVKTYKKRIFKKLEINSFAELFRFGKAFDMIEGHLGSKRGEDEVGLTAGKNLLPELFGRRIGFSTPKYPGFFHIHYVKDFAVKYMDSETCIEFNATLDQIRSLGGDFQHLVTHPEDIPRVNSLLKKLADSSDENEILTFFHRIKLRAEDKEGYTLVITSVRLNLADDTFICMTNTTDQLESFTKKISNTLNNRFMSLEIVMKFRSLTKTEKRIFRDLASGYSVKEIAQQMIRSTHTVEQHKKNIYKKLNVNKVSELIEMASLIPG